MGGFQNGFQDESICPCEVNSAKMFIKKKKIKPKNSKSIF